MMPSSQAHEPTLQSTIQAFEEVLEVERRALHVLDRNSIEAAAEQKLLLTETLSGLTRESLNAKDAERLSSLMEKVRRNHLLLSHARSCVSGILALFQGQDTVGYFDARRPSAAALRLSVRG